MMMPAMEGPKPPSKNSIIINGPAITPCPDSATGIQKIQVKKYAKAKNIQTYLFFVRAGVCELILISP